MRARALVAVLALAPSIAFAGPKGGKKKPPEPAPEAAPAPPPSEPPPTGPKPWADGVSDDVQKQASALYDEGNALFAQLAHAPALEKYKAAVALWDHPLIQFNLAVTLIRLDRFLEASEALERALRFKDAPYKPELYQQAIDYQKLLAGRVGQIEASCDSTAADVLLDGKRWFSCPGTQKARALTGEHTIVGEKAGYLTSSQRLVVTGGAVASAKVTLVPLDAAIKLEYPHRRWIPWSIAGAGVVVALAGGAVWFSGKSQMDDFNQAYARECQMSGCEKDLADHPTLRSQRDGAELKNKIGVSLVAVGGATAVTGIVLVILNRPRRLMPTVEVAPAAGGAKAVVGWAF